MDKKDHNRIQRLPIWTTFDPEWLLLHFQGVLSHIYDQGISSTRYVHYILKKMYDQRQVKEDSLLHIHIRRLAMSLVMVPCTSS